MTPLSVDDKKWYKKLFESELLKKERGNLGSLRFRLTVLTFVAWLLVLLIFSRTIDKFLQVTPPEMMTSIVPSMLDKIVGMFTIVTAVLIIFIVLYVIGKMNLKLKAGPIEVETTSVSTDPKPPVNSDKLNP